jgi:hypothetical protein
MNRREHVGATGGHEHERDATRREFVGQWKAVLASQVDIEASEIDLQAPIILRAVETEFVAPTTVAPAAVRMS